MDYTQVNISCAPENREVILAFVSQIPFDTFEETDSGIAAYIPSAIFGDSEKEQLNELQQRLNFEWNSKLIPAKNWNKTWEAGFEPIYINDFCAIRADFHPSQPSFAHDLVINPKMAFGTGHHETTYLVIEKMEELDFSEKKVLDYGCGTGVLAILAIQCGAKQADAIDYDVLSYENTLENLEANQTSGVNTYHGTLEILADRRYDIILANINRNVILESLDSLYAMLNLGGTLVISGFLAEDEAMMRKAAEKQGFAVNSVKNKNNWLCITLSRDKD